jgi:hypothetical protein
MTSVTGQAMTAYLGDDDDIIISDKPYRATRYSLLFVINTCYDGFVP